ncbi:2-amino-4-hydroxy-6-hydroxymethyldihydropteridine diphosphokinase [Staphylococcus argenteus]|uniref:2-amino-4-hydroxy-6- hydroxymethyldihydropteridine diphosphokinase n=1 Tax=Staphylococcus argenteus TaxID=985002 RepID=UPI000500FB90|nr:2-amino-4-hydroxy-6-hydroxymethyldihydropteridine diphosphokinase [Staphylococcus argenteus]MBE2135000.1 2-amino-4-hydroxy-6-hydroxymethyldihydropteridine diphosphokinase [Staphylococcus argenteus]MBE2147497.1 2-amino-4-hydroxy-6-hydroxymethyldihydropteridine diphosphokinase [Staphylococcus argenteus]MBE2162794.1 2-amino-4-hydroxy-6-hydroxymethyldihydropteridine diphosphokinase [Staphylococcus argenteus]MCG9798341.1 2-amino-4-hydroxy-6-hydroxymethyldihydropteridine diphosphokinase [Staphyloc
MIQAYLGLGSNIGDRENQLNEAIKMLNEYDGIDVLKVSSIYETAPVGYTEQPNFLNLCIGIETTLSVSELLERCLDVEARLHRVRKERWGPRTIDVDILLYGNEITELPNLSVPHPRMNERAFVLIPLNDIAEDVIEPRSNLKIKDLVPNDESVVLYKL